MNKFFDFAKKHLSKIIFFVLATIFFIFFFAFKLNRFFNYDNVLAVKEFILKFSYFGPILIFLLYVIFNIVCIPTLFFTFVSGYLYGTIYGFVVAWVGMTIGFMASFLNTRYLFRKDFLAKFGSNKMVTTLEEYTKKYKGLAVLFFRVFFIFPYNFQNVAYGLSTIKGYHYLWGSVFGVLPTTIFYVWLGDMISKNQMGFTDLRKIFTIIGISITFFAIIFFTSIILKKKFSSSTKT
ncbi:MAG: hypothetical protein A2086_08855 [Spirochaetes bacterium GWD1_27_9]|nr:MAG: hypothetical protein A2Z98_16375 [Spirochaetes bacterium GWB1_27_13]OHD27930.1 MAG: hypothetical protein A2Y34_14750 [Spirochaetes bacterium GWC1_27_15]OHD30739.1 MAG: hypothetical protein A2086_08855 [Spirochaetes bacterium GWD1_27_9]